MKSQIYVTEVLWFCISELKIDAIFNIISLVIQLPLWGIKGDTLHSKITVRSIIAFYRFKLPTSWFEECAYNHRILSLKILQLLVYFNKSNFDFGKTLCKAVATATNYDCTFHLFDSSLFV